MCIKKGGYTNLPHTLQFATIAPHVKKEVNTHCHKDP